jgi:hypothetical protein
VFEQITVRLANGGAVMDNGATGLRTYGAGDRRSFAPDPAGNDVEAVHHRLAEGGNP